MNESDVNAAIAEFMEPKPASPLDDFFSLGGDPSPLGAWVCVCVYELGDVPTWIPYRFDSDDSPRSLMASVEAKLAEMGLMGPYLCELLDSDKRIPGSQNWWLATAPASTRAQAAAKVILDQRRDA